MSSTIIFSISALFYCLILLIVFFSKNHYKTLENKIYSSLIITTFLGLVIEISGVFVLLGNNQLLSFLQMKGYQVYLITWIGLFTLYTLVVFRKDSNDNKLAGIPFITILYIISIIIITILPTKIYNNNGSIYTYGPSINYVYLFSLICILIIVFKILTNIKNIFKKKYIPMSMFVALGIIVLIIQTINPSLLLITSAEALVTFLMYFTIENPDIKTIKELKFTKTLLEKENTATIKGFNDLALNLKEPLSKLTDFGNAKIEKENVEQDLKNIKQEALILVDKINSIIDLTRIENNILENNLNYYKTDELIAGIKEIIDNKNIKAEYQIADNIPNTLYGNINKIKQIIIYLTNFINKSFTKCQITINIQKYQVGNICKLKFSFILPIENLKSDIKLNKINDKYIIDNNDIEYNIYEKLIEMDNNKNDISNVDNNISFNFQIYNKINNNYIEDTIDNNKEIEYFNASDKRILIMDDNRKNTKDIIEMLKKYNVSIDTATNIEELMNQIESNKVYDLILYSDTVNTIKEYSINNENIPHILSRLKLIAGYKIPLVLVGNKKYKNIDYIIRPIDTYELNNIMLKYLKDNDTI